MISPSADEQHEMNVKLESEVLHDSKTSKEEIKVMMDAMLKAIKTPIGFVGFFILLVVIVSGAILFLVIISAIKLPDQERQNWFEVNSQILNACFTLTTLLTQPTRAKLAYWTYKWYTSKEMDTREIYATLIHNNMPEIHLQTGASKPGSIGELLEDNESNSRGRDDSIVEVITVPMESIEITERSVLPNESAPLSDIQLKNTTDFTPAWKWLTIVALMNMQCIGQYPITIVMWMYAGRALSRPVWVIPLFLPISFLSGATGGIWPMLIARKKQANATRI